MSAKLIIATRESRLALWQTHWVRDRLSQAHPELQVELLPLSTKGDQILDRPLAAIGGKGLFLKELEQAMLAGHAHLAVHSMKDIPVDMDEQFMLPAVLERADPADALVSPRYHALDELPAGGRVGTSSLRRQLQIKSQRPDLQVLDLRGNVDTRLRKLDEGRYEAIILAVAGLSRLGLDHRISGRLQPPRWIPAPAQAAVAVQCLTNDERTRKLLQVLNHAPTRAAVTLERELALYLQADCHTPFGAYAEPLDGGGHRLLGLLAGVGGVQRAELLVNQSDDRARIEAMARELQQRCDIACH